jgi:hypothetical protein
MERINLFIQNNSDYKNTLLNNYKMLNNVNFPSKKRRFPYNILETEIIPTYKTITLQIKNKPFFDVPKKGGGGNMYLFYF